MARKVPKKTTHKRKKHTIDHEWLKEAFYKDHLEKGKTIASIAKRYVRVKKSSTVGSISGVLYGIKKQHKIEQAGVADLIVADPPYVVNGEAGEGKTHTRPKVAPDYSYTTYSNPKYAGYNVKPDTTTLKSLQQKADYHLIQYKKALREILGVIGGEE